MKEDVIVGIPDLGMAGVKWEADIKPVIEQSSYRGLIPTRGPGSQGGKPVRITFRNGRALHFMAGGGNDKQRAGATARVLIVTETDALDEISASSKEGQSKIDQLEGRVNAFDLDARIFTECTVSSEDAYTWSNYTRGTESRIVCPCPHCSGWVAPERDHFIGWDTADTEFDAGERAHFVCPGCSERLSEDDRRQMNLDAKLIHRGQEVAADGSVVGEAPKTDTLGFRWSAFNNLLTSCRLLGMTEWNAERAEDPIAAEVTVKQQRWTMPAEAAKVETVPLSIAVVRGSAPGYEGRCNQAEMWVIPEWKTMTSVHVDVGGRLFELVRKCTWTQWDS